MWAGAEAMFPSSAAVGYASLASAVENEKGSTKTAAGETALGDLYAKFAPAIYAHCRRFLQSPAAARDVSTNVCLNLLREHNVHTRAAPTLAANSPHVSSAESGLADREFVNAVLDRCGEGSAKVAIMHYLDGMSQVEIAEVLGITRRTVFNRLRKLSRIAGDLLHAVPRPSAAKEEE
jgi:RNA polymerase sigma-70 factor (ECF subfamily)